MANKGIVIRMICENPDCVYSDEQLEIEKALAVSPSTGNHSFIVPKACPRCRASLELIGFVSGDMRIVADDKKSE